MNIQSCRMNESQRHFNFFRSIGQPFHYQWVFAKCPLGNYQSAGHNGANKRFHSPQRAMLGASCISSFEKYDFEAFEHPSKFTSATIAIQTTLKHFLSNADRCVSWDRRGSKPTLQVQSPTFFQMLHNYISHV